MFNAKWLVALVWFLTAIHPGFAAEGATVVGIWKLVSYDIEIQATRQKEPLFGRHPTGFVTFTPEGRVFFVLTADGRKPAKSVQDRADLLNTLIAYTGLYSVEGERWITKVDVAWNPEWVGTEQARSFKVDANRLQVLTPWRVMPNWPEKGMTRSVVTFERAK